MTLMRIKINFALDREIRIPIEYNYHVYLALRRTLFAYLRKHEAKLEYKYKKKFPHLTFSQLLIPQRRVEFAFITIASPYMSLILGSSDQRFLELLAAALQDRGRFPLYRNQVRVTKIQVLEEPFFTPRMNWKMLSPLILARRKSGKIFFAQPTDADLSSLLAGNLISRYQRLLPRPVGQEEILITLNPDYMRSHRNLTKLTTVRNLHYKAIICPFSLKAPIELTRLAYAGGIGEKTQYGFGMIEPANSEITE